MNIPRLNKQPSKVPTMLLALIITFTLIACYEKQISKIEFETTTLGAVIVADPVQLTKGVQPYPKLSQHNAIVLVHRSQQVINIPGQRVTYNIDAAFINENCRIVRVLTQIPPLPTPEPTKVTTPAEQAGPLVEQQPKPAPDTLYSSGYPAKYVAIAISPVLNNRGVRPGQKVKLSGPASRSGCD